MVDAIARTEGLSLVTPGGAFYALIDCRALLGARAPDGTIVADDMAFADFLLKQAGVAAVPGSVYELSGYFRISTATDDDNLNIALERIANATRLLTPREGAQT